MTCEVSFHAAYAIADLLGVSVPWDHAKVISGLVESLLSCVVSCPNDDASVVAYLRTGESFSGEDHEVVAAKLARWIVAVSKEADVENSSSSGLDSLCGLMGRLTTIVS